MKREGALPITSSQNPRIKELKKLRERRYREKSGLFLVEGSKEVSMALDAGVELVSLFFSPEFFRGDEEGILRAARERGVRLFSLPPDLFSRVSYRENPDGLLAVARQFPVDLGRVELGPDPLVVVVEALEKPGNLGAILRCADAVGAHAVLVCDPVVDPFNPNVVRASRGALFTLKIALASSQEVMSWLLERGVNIVVTSPRGDRKYTQVDYTRPTAVVVGNESRGLSSLWLEGPFHRVIIPMKGRVDSLNVSTATAVVLYEALRQREESF